MKKLLVASVLALGVALASQQTASAWHDFKFSVGFSVSCRGGGNSCFWGMFKGADYPFPCDFAPDGQGFAGSFLPYYVPPADGHYAAAPAWQGPAPAAAPQAPAAAYNTGYQPVGYFYPGYSPNQVPSYWYGR